MKKSGNKKIPIKEKNTQKHISCNTIRYAKRRQRPAGADRKKLKLNFLIYLSYT
jgi:hypothetical protein